MDILGYAIFGIAFTVLLCSLFTGLIWAAVSDGKDELDSRTHTARSAGLA